MSVFSPNLIFNAAGFFLSQKAVAIYKTYNENKEQRIPVLDNLINTNQALFGLGGDIEEVLSGTTLIAETSIRNADVNTECQIMEYPIETGVRIADHIVFQPTEIAMSIVFPAILYGSVYSELQSLYANSTKLIILTKARIYRNMVLQGIPHDERPQNINRLIFNLRFKEIIEIPSSQKTTEDVSDPSNADTLKQGTANLSDTGGGLVDEIGRLF